MNCDETTAIIGAANALAFTLEEYFSEESSREDVARALVEFRQAQRRASGSELTEAQAEDMVRGFLLR
jgi:hypothetical protein